MATFIKPIQKSLPQNWYPKIGYFYSSFINHLNDSEFSTKAKDIITNETLNILGNCSNPNTSEKRFSSTGVVVGYVQSGKTTSFTALSAAALDNGYDLIIILAGRSNPLYLQNSKEIRESFSFAIDKDKAHVFSLDKDEGDTIKEIKNLPLTYLRKKGPFSKPVISVHLKHQGHINALTKRLKEERGRLLETMNVLLIDDEADNASLNTLVEEGDQSAIYKSINNLREILKKHSYVEYTATPQALLLSSRDQNTSPQWARIISPGEKYVGTSLLFSTSSKAKKVIPDKEIFDGSDDIEELPKSFYEALYSFLLVAAQRVLSPEKFGKIVTMMVHPDRAVKSHLNWGEKIEEEFNEWIKDIYLTGPETFLKSKTRDLKKAYENLKDAGKNKEIRSFDELSEQVPYIIELIKITTLNADHKNENSRKNVNWEQSPFHIVIGGDLLDRGFVVKGLVTTYMPRSKGIGNSDTIQQRGRFYGYKKDHLPFIRTWLGKDTLKAFTSYAKTEKDLYERLKNFSSRVPQEPLTNWLRTMVLDPDLKPCRRNIIAIDLIPNTFNRAGWFWTKNPLLLETNRYCLEKLIYEFKNHFKRKAGSKNNWTPNMRALIAEGLDLQSIIEIISNLELEASDRINWAQLLFILGHARDCGFGGSIALMGTESIHLDDFAASTSKKYEFLNYSDIRQGPNANYDFPGEEKIISSKKNDITFQIFIKTLGSNVKSSLVLAIKTPGQRILTEVKDPIFIENEDHNPFSN